MQRRSWEFQRCWMQKTWWLLGFLTASVSWHTCPSTTTTSMDAPRVSISVSQCPSLPLFPSSCLIWLCVSVYYVFGAVGGMGGIKRPADGPTDEPSGKKNQPVAAKVFPSSKPARENSPPPSSNITRPSPSPKQTRNATKVTFTAWILFWSEKCGCLQSQCDGSQRQSSVVLPNCCYKRNPPCIRYVTVSINKVFISTSWNPSHSLFPFSRMLWLRNPIRQAPWVTNVWPATITFTWCSDI